MWKIKSHTAPKPPTYTLQTLRAVTVPIDDPTIKRAADLADLLQPLIRATGRRYSGIRSNPARLFSPEQPGTHASGDRCSKQQHRASA